MEIAIVLIVVLVIFGPKRLPGLGSSLGRGIREFSHGIKGKESPEPLELEDSPTASTSEARATAEPGQR